jgi:arylformamidase
MALTLDDAHWIINRGVRLVGVDYLSVESYEDRTMTHRVLLEDSVIIFETLNLYNIEAGEYELICLLLRGLGAEEASARAVPIK